MELQQELTAKYKPALDAMAQQNNQVTSISLQGNKLYVEAYAPTQEAKNAAWDRIKAIDSSYADLPCEIKVGSAPNDATELPGAPRPAPFPRFFMGGPWTRFNALISSQMLLRTWLSTRKKVIPRSSTRSA